MSSATYMLTEVYPAASSLSTVAGSYCVEYPQLLPNVTITQTEKQYITYPSLG